MQQDIDKFLLQGNGYEFANDIYLQGNNRIFACEDEYLSVSCFKCVGKDKCTNYRLKDYAY